MKNVNVIMDRNANEAELQLREAVLEVYRLYKSLYPNGEWLSISVNKNYLAFNNSYWSMDASDPLNYAELNKEGETWT